jgi:P-type conjugative transfer protein TrbJ
MISLRRSISMKTLRRLTLRTLSAVVLGAASSLALAKGGGSAVPVGATEFTQILNNVEIAAGVAKQAQTVSEMIQSKIVQIEQFATMTRNLEKLAAGEIAQALAPYDNQLKAYQDLMGSVTALKTAAERAGSTLSNRAADFERSGLKDPAKYLAYEFGLARKRGGIHQQRMQQDIASLDAMQQRNAEFRRVASRTASITGNLQGLQQLSQLSAMATGELMELKTAVLAQNVDAAMERRSTQDNEAWRAALYESARKGAAERANRPAPTGVEIDPLKAWEHLQNK